MNGDKVYYIILTENIFLSSDIQMQVPFECMATPGKELVVRGKLGEFLQSHGLEDSIG